MAVGDRIQLHANVGLDVAAVDRARALVLRGAAEEGDAPVPYDFTWPFVLHRTADGRTRLVVRVRHAYRTLWASLLAEPVAVASSSRRRRCCGEYGTEQCAWRQPTSRSPPPLV